MKRTGLFSAILTAGAFWMLSGFLAPSADAQTGAVPKRADIAEKDTWKLQDLYADNAAWEADFSRSSNALGSFASYKGKLAESGATLLACLKLSDSVSLILDNIYVYASLKMDEDQQVSAAQELSGRAGDLYGRFSEAVSFITPEITDMPKEKIDAFLSATPGLGVYRHMLENILRSKEHILTSREEEILAKAGPVVNSMSGVFEMVNNADMEYGTIKDENGEEIAISKERYYALTESKDRRVRRDANQAFYRAYLNRENTLAATLAGSVKADMFQMSARGYSSTLAWKLDQDNIPTSVYTNLVSAVNANLAPLRKWAEVRKRLLGYDTLYTYDMSVSLLPGKPREYPYDSAKAICLSGLKPLGKKYLTDFATAFNSRWVDVYETDGKNSGAYQTGTYSSHPYLLMNYNGTLDHVFTLAHEMGHAMNSFYSNKNEPYVYSGHTMFTAEVASTCNEAILMKHLLSTTKDKEEKLRLLLQYIDQIIGTFYTQVMFSEFELAIHERVEKGEALSAANLRQTYRDIYQRYYGPTVVMDSINDLVGLRIPHFYRSFYVYQYATCYTAAQALSQGIMDGKKGALEAYMRFLSTGTSKYAVDALKDAGVDMTTADPTAYTIKVFGDLVDQVEKLLNEMPKKG